MFAEKVNFCVVLWNFRMAERLTDDEFQAFLVEMQENEICWNKKHPLYAKTNAREKAILGVAKRLHMTPDRLKKLIIYMKKKFNEQEQRNMKKSGSEADGKAPAEWKWYGECQFLKPGLCISENATQSFIFKNQKSRSPVVNNTSFAKSVKSVIDYNVDEEFDDQAENTEANKATKKEAGSLEADRVASFSKSTSEHHKNTDRKRSIKDENIIQNKRQHIGFSSSTSTDVTAFKTSTISSDSATLITTPSTASLSPKAKSSSVTSSSANSNEAIAYPSQSTDCSLPLISQVSLNNPTSTVTKVITGNLTPMINENRESLIESASSLVALQLRRSNISEESLINFHADVIRFIKSYQNL
ncbi:uncharacterized protein LOC129804929 [Phlebotomus papatasi]|uniref:uncharacterized protein LOC129804929 n=1 Tax=Phlebotomus papatasi TaxID=29031 RepID=UPI002483E388|nr:uncharacterized protein LOC129804929 [Phlebotomus papatasi]